MADTVQCTQCEAPMEFRGYRHVEQVGPNKVADATGMALQCPKCGAVELALGELGKYEQRAAAIALRSGKVTGEVVRYARKALGLTQADLGKIIKTAPETVSRWESETYPIHRAEQLAIVALLDSAARGEDVESLAYESQDRVSSTELEVPALRPTGCD